MVEPVLDPDWEDRGALVGTLNDEIVALANYVRLRDPASAEVAFAVADSLQGQGVGTRLLEQLAETAAASGISVFVAEVMSGNAPMLRVFADAGFAVSRSLEGGTTASACRSSLPYRDAVDERDQMRSPLARAVLLAAVVAGRSRRARSAASSSGTSPTELPRSPIR